MAKLTHLIAGIAVAAGATYGGIKAYVHYQVKSDLDDAIAAARPFVDIRYGGISSELSGSVTVEDIRIRPVGFPETFEIDGITLIAPDIQFWLGGHKDLQQQGKIPENIRLAVNGLRMPTDGIIFETIRESQQQMARIMELELDQCSVAQVFGARDYQAVGIDELVMDSDFGYGFTVASPGIELNMNFASRGIESGNFSITLSGVSQSMASWMMNQPGFGGFAMQYRLEPELATKALRHCANLRGISESEYLAQVASEPDEAYMLGLGFVPGPGLRGVIQEMLARGGDLEVTAHPAEAIDFRTLHLYQPEQIPALLGVSVSLNGKPVDDLSVSMLDLTPYLDGDGVTRPRGLKDLVTWGQEEEATTEELRKPSAPPPPEARFRKVPPSELRQHVGYSVRILAKGNRQRNGRLLAVEGSVATLEQRIHGGTLTTSVSLKEIQKVEVYR